MDVSTLRSSVKPYDTSRRRRLIMYLLVGVLGVAINQGVLYLATGIIGISYVLGGFLGVAISILINYAINDAWTWQKYGTPGIMPWVWRGIKYTGTRIVGIGVHMVALVVFVELLGLHYLLANLLAIAIGFAWGFGASDVLVWKTTDSSFLEASEQRWRQINSQIDRPTAYVLVFAALLFVFFATFTILLYRGYWMTGGDFGSYVHAFETTRQRIAFMDTGRYRAGNPTNSYWGEHFSLTLFIIYPFYWLFPTQETLLIIKSFILALSVPLLWLVARSHVSTRLAGVIVLLYGFNPFFHAAWLFDFQEQIFLPVLFFAAYYFYLNKRYRLFIALVAAALLTNEFVVFIAAGGMAGLAIAAYRDSKRSLRDEWYVFASVFLMAGGVHLIAGSVIAQYNFFTGIPVDLVAEPFRPYVETRRAGIGELLLLLVQRPMLLWESIMTDGHVKIAFFALFLMPVAFLSFFDEMAIGAFAPYLGFAWVFAGNEIYYIFGAHYPLYLLPFLYIGAVRVLGNLSWTSESRKLLIRILVVVLVISALGTVAGGTDRQATPGEPEHADILKTSVEHVPEDKTLITQNDVYPHFADRPNTRFIASAEMFREYEQIHGTVRPSYILLDTKLESRPEHWDTELRDAFGDDLTEEYGLSRYENGVWLFERGYDGDTKGITDEYEQPSYTYTATDLSPEEGLLYDGMIESEVGVEDSTVWFGPYEMLPPGTYNVTFHVAVESASETPVTTLEVVSGPDQEQLAEKSVVETDGWEEVTTTITIDRITSDIEFRGTRDVADGSIAIRQVDVEPAEPVDNQEDG